MRRKKIVSMLLVATMAATMFAGCGNDSGKKGSSGGVKEFDAFFAVPGSEINDDNEIQKIIEEKTGVRVKETWLTGQTADEAIGTMIAGGEYPDFIEGASGQKQLYEAGALVPLDDYIESAHTMTRHSGSRQEYLNGLTIRRSRHWISILTSSRNIMKQIQQWLMEQKIFHIQSFVRTGDISVLRMHHSSLTDIQTMDHVW